MFSKKVDNPLSQIRGRKRFSKTKKTLIETDCVLKIRKELLDLVTLHPINHAILYRAELSDFPGNFAQNSSEASVLRYKWGCNQTMYSTPYIIPD